MILKIRVKLTARKVYFDHGSKTQTLTFQPVSDADIPRDATLLIGADGRIDVHVDADRRFDAGQEFYLELHPA